MSRAALPVAFLTALLAAAPALAHPGHVESVDGHTHWLALAAAGAALIVALGAALRSVIRRRRTALDG